MNWKLKYVKKVDDDGVYLARFNEPEGLFTVGVSVQSEKKAIEAAKKNILDSNYDAIFN